MAEMTAELSRAQERESKTIVAASVGNMFECFDLIIYGTVAGTIARLFFPGTGTQGANQGVRARIARHGANGMSNGAFDKGAAYKPRSASNENSHRGLEI